MSETLKPTRLYLLTSDNLITDTWLGFVFDTAKDDCKVLFDAVKNQLKRDNFKIFDMASRSWIIDDRNLAYALLESVHGLKFLLILPSQALPPMPLKFVEGHEPKELIEMRHLSLKTAESASRIQATYDSLNSREYDNLVKLKLFARHFFAETLEMPGYRFKNVERFDQTTSADNSDACAYVVYKNQTTEKFEAIKFYIKTYRGGKSKFEAKDRTLDPREVFVYKFLELVGVGARVGFFFDVTDYNNVYVASQEVEENFSTFSVDCGKADFLNYFKSNTNCLKGLVWIELLGKILHLADIDLYSFGFLKTVSSFEDIRVVDLRVYDDYISQRDDMLERFLKAGISIKDEGHLDADTVKMCNIGLSEKIDIAKEIMYCMGASLEANLQVAEEKTRRFFQESNYRSNLKADPLSRFDIKVEKFDEYLISVKHQLRQFLDKFHEK